MAIHKTNTKYPNRLWRIRKRLGLRQKQVLPLLGSHSKGLLPDLENGLRLPDLKAALTLELLYGMPIRAMFPDLVKKLAQQLENKIKKYPLSYKNIITESGELKDYCTFSSVLDEEHPTQLGRDKLRRHITTSLRRLSLITNPHEQPPSKI